MSAKAWLLGGMTTLQEVQKLLGTKFWTELAEDHGKAPGSLAFDAGAQGYQPLPYLQGGHVYCGFWPTSAAQKILAEAPYSQFALNKLSQAPRGLEEKES